MYANTHVRRWDRCFTGTGLRGPWCVPAVPEDRIIVRITERAMRMRRQFGLFPLCNVARSTGSRRSVALYYCAAARYTGVTASVELCRRTVTPDVLLAVNSIYIYIYIFLTADTTRAQ